MQNGIFKMTCSGQFSAAHNTPNQCVVEGHAIYEFEVNLLFPGDTPLDENGFLVDTAEVKKMIVETPLTGSCEQMHLQLRDMFCRRLPEIIACKISIKPFAGCKGWIDYIFASSPVLYPLLQQ